MKLTKSLTKLDFSEDIYKMGYFLIQRSKELRSPENPIPWDTDSSVGRFSIGRHNGHTEAVKYASGRLHAEGFTVHTFLHGQTASIDKLRGTKRDIVIIDAFTTTYDNQRKMDELRKVIAEFTHAHGTVFLLIQ